MNIQYFYLFIQLFGEVMHATQLFNFFCSFSVDIQPRFHAVFKDGKMKMNGDESEDENDEEEESEDDEDKEDDDGDDDDEEESEEEEDGEESEKDEDDIEGNDKEEDNEGLANFT